MSKQTDLHLVLSQALETDELSLEHDTMVVSVELTKQVVDALGKAALTTASSRTPVVELARAGS